MQTLGTCRTLKQLQRRRMSPANRSFSLSLGDKREDSVKLVKQSQWTGTARLDGHGTTEQQLRPLLHTHDRSLEIRTDGRRSRVRNLGSITVLSFSL